MVSTPNFQLPTSKANGSAERGENVDAGKLMRFSPDTFERIALGIASWKLGVDEDSLE
jgi:hypothetical protein